MTALRIYPLALLILACSISACDDSRTKVHISGVDGAIDEPDAAPPTLNDGGSFFPDLPPPADAPPAADRPPPETDGPSSICGNSVIETGEQCDDGNARPGDGCSGICRLEPNFVCPAAGAMCMSTIVCGDGKVMGGEACDDGNTNSNDGCSALCQVEMGYACAMPGQMCTPVVTAKCGDGVVNQGESCDDGGMVGNDGCSATCQIEAGWSCPMPNTMCKKDEYCGDGKLNGAEQCDDGGNTPGDGCSGACNLEPFFTCPTPGMRCQTTIVCGDLKVIGDEACDDGNTVASDGCAADCKRVEPGYSCPTASNVGGMCQPMPQDRCGDGRLSYGEFCDDGNSTANDGCSPTCTVDPGYTCPAAGAMCMQIGFCGDGKLSVADGEQCDDFNKNPADGCSPQCIIEANYVCPTPGQLCSSTIRCGDRKVGGAETCDDGNTAVSDGCSNTCQLEPGWTCIVGGTCFAARCGDGMKVGAEQCDDGGIAGGDGCSATCQLEQPGPTEGDGWMCPTPGQQCIRTDCGNGVKEGTEQCDDANNDTADGCSPFCRREPVCPSGGGACNTSCGDGLLLAVDMAAGQQCDDGNTVGGDGCSATCTIEPGYQCTTVPVTQNPLILPVVYRDFKGFNETGGHPDFERYSGNVSNVVQPMLSAAGKPLHVAGTTTVTTNNKPEAMGTDFFAMWYADNATYNKTIPDFMTFTQLASGVYQFDQSTDNNLFFPIDGRGWGNYPGPGTDPAGQHRNFHFTSEVRYWFEYKGGEKLDFTGDDDVWFFINRRLAVDLGGVHGAQQGTVTLHASNGTGQACDIATPCGGATRPVDFGLVLGSVYEVVVFQAERHTTRSRYKLTLSNFTGSRSSCATVCGDGIVAGNETCDLGPGRNTGAYGTCNANCTLPPRCGDAIVQPNEQCDDGVNLSIYGGSAKVCAPGCVFAGYCGDGSVNAANGEVCDQGADNGKGYGFCSATCQLGPRCGDGAVTNTEQCDDGVNNGTSGSNCTAMCTKKCGNAVMDPREQCDDGTANNVGGYGKCTNMCTLGPRCGDGIRQDPPEECDDGKNDGSYGSCGLMCKLGPRCGDMVVQMEAGEVCDKGAANEANPYGMSKCSTRCRPAPYCGDKKVDVSFGEGCDDGVNSGQPGSCKTDCSGPVPLPSCGDGTMQPGEQCDDGANNGTAGSMCDTTCHRKCGNGFRDPGETCDDGKNDGSYGGCNANCTPAGYCGDGVKQAQEGCDLGMANAANPYGPNKCTLNCMVAPYCGDGRIQTAFGEMCDGTPGCSPMCTMIIIQ